MQELCGGEWSVDVRRGPSVVHMEPHDGRPTVEIG